MKQSNHVCVNTSFKHLSRLTDSGSPFSEHLDSKSHFRWRWHATFNPSLLTQGLKHVDPSPTALFHGVTLAAVCPEHLKMLSINPRRCAPPLPLWHMINKALDAHVHPHPPNPPPGHTCTHKQESCLPSLKLLTPCQDRSVTLCSAAMHAPAHQGYMCACEEVQFMCVIICGHLLNIWVLQTSVSFFLFFFFNLTRQLTSLPISIHTPSRVPEPNSW